MRMDENTNTADTGNITPDTATLTDQLLAETEQEQVEEQTEEQSPEEARKEQLNQQLNTLIEDGWTAEELEAFSQDAQVREDIQKNGKTVRQAARAYERRLRAAEKAETKPAKHGVPTTRTASNTGAGGRNQIAEMSDKEFDAYYRQVMEDSLSGKKHRL
jgi:hypothetical protein